MPSQTHQSFCVGKPKLGERFQHFGMRLEFDAVHRAGGVKHGADGTLRDEFGIELLERAGGGVAGVGKGLFTCGCEFCVEASNSLMAM